jgi:drug/metabolite transporter (DMT)-like permease
MAGSRFLTAGVILLVFLLLRRVPLPPRAMLGPIATTGLLLLFGGNLLVTMAERTVPSGMAAVIIANLPFFMVVFEALRPGGERITGLGILGIGIGFAGTLILMWPKLRVLEARGPGDLKGEAMLMGANLCWTVGSIYSKHRVRDVAPLMAVALEMLIAGLALTGLGLVLGEAARFHPTPRAMLAVAWLVVAGSLFGYSAYMWLLSHVSAVKVATYAYVNPVIAVGLGALILGEPIDRFMLVGTLVILGGVAAVNLARVRLKT